MDIKLKREIVNLKNSNGITHEFMERYEKEWAEATRRLKESGVNLAKIVIVKVEGQRE